MARTDSRGAAPSLAAEQPSGALKMKDLEKVTGVGRETIRFYIQSGLLPQPERRGRNVALYDSAFVDRIRLIKELQQKHFLPLSVIKDIVRGEGARVPATLQTVIDLDRHLFRAAGIDLHRPPVRLSDVARRTGVSAFEIRKLAEIGAIEITTQDRTQWLHDPDVRVVEIWGQIREAGFNETLGFGPESLRIYVDAVRRLAPAELRLFTGTVIGKAEGQRALGMAEAAIEIGNQLIGVVRASVLLRRFAQNGAASSSSPRRTPKRARKRSRSSR